MKAEHRKELQTNALAEGIARFVGGVKAGPSRAGLLVWGLLALVVVVFLAWRYFSSAHLEQVSHQWSKVDDAGEQLAGAKDMNQVEEALKEIGQIAASQAGTPAARALRFQEARARLRLGLERLYSVSDRKSARENLEKAATIYEELSRTSDSPLLWQEAMLMSAKARESLGQVGDAVDKYRLLTERAKDSVAGKEAAQRLEYLSDPANRKRVEEFYAEMDKLAEKTAAPTPPSELPPPVPPPSPPPAKP
jgi:hypothetical protein